MRAELTSGGNAPNPLLHSCLRARTLRHEGGHVSAAKAAISDRPVKDIVAVTARCAGSTTARAGRGEDEFGGGAFLLLVPCACHVGQWDRHRIDGEIAASGVFGQLQVSLSPNFNRWVKTRKTQDLQGL
jgi:hypothetical protein